MGDAPVGRQAVVVSLVAVGATAIGAAAASWAMFLSEHDLDALAVVLVAAGSVGVGAAFELGHRVAAGSRELGELAQRIGDGATGADATAERGGATGDTSPSPRRSAPSELTRLREELASMAQRLDESRRRERDQESARRELIAWVSHDLRSPLAGIRAMAEAMEDGVVDDPATVQRYLRTIGEESQRLSRLVDDLFELARIHQGTLQLHRRGGGPRRPGVRRRRRRRARCRGPRGAAGRRGRRAAADPGERARARPGAAEPARQRHPPHAGRRHGGGARRLPARRRAALGRRRVRGHPGRRPRPGVRGGLPGRRGPPPRRGRRRPGAGHRQGPGRGPRRRPHRREPRAGLLLHDPAAGLRRDGRTLNRPPIGRPAGAC